MAWHGSQTRTFRAAKKKVIKWLRGLGRWAHHRWFAVKRTASYRIWIMKMYKNICFGRVSTWWWCSVIPSIPLKTAEHWSSYHRIHIVQWMRCARWMYFLKLYYRMTAYWWSSIESYHIRVISLLHSFLRFFFCCSRFVCDLCSSAAYHAIDRWHTQ